MDCMFSRVVFRHINARACGGVIPSILYLIKKSVGIDFFQLDIFEPFTLENYPKLLFLVTFV